MDNCKMKLQNEILISDDSDDDQNECKHFKNLNSSYLLSKTTTNIKLRRINTNLLKLDHHHNESPLVKKLKEKLNKSVELLQAYNSNNKENKSNESFNVSNVSESISQATMTNTNDSLFDSLNDIYIQNIDSLVDQCLKLADGNLDNLILNCEIIDAILEPKIYEQTTDFNNNYNDNNNNSNQRQKFSQSNDDCIIISDEHLVNQLKQENAILREDLNQTKKETLKLVEEVRYVCDLKIKEILSEKSRSEYLLKNDYEKRLLEAKLKKWCAYCGEEAELYCCWSTVYCDQICQQSDWPKHYSSCLNPFVQSSNSIV